LIKELSGCKKKAQVSPKVKEISYFEKVVKKGKIPR
jgi:hypothetical protein